MAFKGFEVTKEAKKYWRLRKEEGRATPGPGGGRGGQTAGGRQVVPEASLGGLTWLLKALRPLRTLKNTGG